MTKKKILKISLVIVAIGLLSAGIGIYYMMNMPHRDVQATETDYSLAASDIVNEYLNDQNVANQKYLDDEGESKILEVKGIVSNISKDFNDATVVLLKGENDNAGVSCTLVKDANRDASQYSIGKAIKIKGVIRSGASFDPDLDMYEHVIMEDCKLINK
jgi:uncharacterized protein (UPF0333 family)